MAARVRTWRHQDITADNHHVSALDRHTSFNPRLVKDMYEAGDLYDDQKIQTSRREWSLDGDRVSRPYLSHVKSLSRAWPHLRLLADFMEISSHPAKWKQFRQDTPEARSERGERAERTNVTRLDYFEGGLPERTDCATPSALREALDVLPPNEDGRLIKFRLFVVEDLSRDVIEVLGSYFDIEPAFFREHIFDYTWYNTRDPWMDPPELDLAAKGRRWIQLRFARARYFKTKDDFIDGNEATKNFNVSRRLEDDQNNRAIWDEEGAVVGITRTRASFWLNHTSEPHPMAIGILLLDPTITNGFPLWLGYRNWEPTPWMGATVSTENTPPRNRSFFDNFLYWAQRPDSFRSASPAAGQLNTHVPIYALLHLVCAEWLTMSGYIKSRLGQIEWEVSAPEQFLRAGGDVDDALKKLHVWRRVVPLYREMLDESIERLSRFACHLPPKAPSHQPKPEGGLGNSKPDMMNKYTEDFERVLEQMNQNQKRIDRLTSVVASVISIADSRRGLDENRNLARLTWLGTFFIPLSFIASLFSVTDNLSATKKTIGYAFAAGLPLSALSILLAYVLTLPKVQAWLRSLWKSDTPPLASDDDVFRPNPVVLETKPRLSGQETV